MHDLNSSLDALRQVMPYAHGPSVKKLSKMSTLLLARNYIVLLTRSMEEMRRLLADAYSRGNVPLIPGAPIPPGIPTGAPLPPGIPPGTPMPPGIHARIPVRPEAVVPNPLQQDTHRLRLHGLSLPQNLPHHLIDIPHPGTGERVTPPPSPSVLSPITPTFAQSALPPHSIPSFGHFLNAHTQHRIHPYCVHMNRLSPK